MTLKIRERLRRAILDSTHFFLVPIEKSLCSDNHITAKSNIHKSVTACSSHPDLTNF